MQVAGQNDRQTVGTSQLLCLAKPKITREKRVSQRNAKITNALPDNVQRLYIYVNAIIMIVLHTTILHPYYCNNNATILQ
jgi:hypothetical protein